MYLYIVDVLDMDYKIWSAHYSIKIQFQTSCLQLDHQKWGFSSEVKLVLSCHHHRLKHFNFQYIYHFLQNCKNQAFSTISAVAVTSNISFIIGFPLAFLRRRLFAIVHLNISVVEGASFFPVIPYFLADKWFWIFAPDVAPGANLIPPRQYFFHFHLRLLSESFPY